MQQPITRDTHRGIASSDWVHNCRVDLYEQYRDGEENWHIHALDIETGDCRDLTPIDGVSAFVTARSDCHPDSIVVGLNDRGYAVLSVNFRGSTGFGKAFINAGDREWAGKMHDDLIDAVDWAVERGIAQRDKIAIMGGSYGGYATLAGQTFTPEVFACGVDLVGPSNLVPTSAPCRATRTVSESIPAGRCKAIAETVASPENSCGN